MSDETTVIDLAMPPSVNSIWRTRRGSNKPYLSPLYQSWKRDSDNRYLASKKLWRPVKGNFRCHVTLDVKRRRGDADNKIKVVLDWLQRVGLIENDELCDFVSVAWGRAPEGCRIRIKSILARVA